MKQLLSSLVLFFLVFNVFGQEPILLEEDIPELDSIIKTLENDFESNKNFLLFKSFPQTIADYFELKTKTPNIFIQSLKKSKDFNQLAKDINNLQIDRNVFIIKSIFSNYKKKKKIKIESFEIENSRNHSITLGFTDSLDNDSIKYFYTTYENNGITSIRGFYLKDKFESINIPSKYNDWINYSDYLTVPDEPIFFYDKKEKSPNIEKTIVDSLIKYYGIVTHKPRYKKKGDYSSYKEKSKLWKRKMAIFSDSLFVNDDHFRKLLKESLIYANENKVSNGDLEDFVAHLISKEQALDLMRQTRQIGSCSFDNSPVVQQRRIAKLSAQTHNWSIFIKSFLNVLNDNVSRVANSNIASARRKTYIDELVKLKLDIGKLLFGSNFRISNSVPSHYFSNGNKIAKAFAKLDTNYQYLFEQNILDILQNDSIDTFNKLHFYNTFKSYQYYLKDSLRLDDINTQMEHIISILPDVIKSRIVNPNLELTNLLHAEKEELGNFEILSSIIGTIHSYSYYGDCWIAKIYDKNSDGKLVYDLTMGIEEEITPLKNFIIKKDSLRFRIENNLFLQKILHQNTENVLYLKFTNDRSFVNHKNRVLKKIPKELVSKLDFEDAISLYISFSPRKYVRFILLKNNNVLVLGIPKNFTLPGYSFEELMTEEKDSFLSKSYESYKLFSSEGRMLN